MARAASLLALLALLLCPRAADALFIATPAPGAFQMRADLAGKHPRLYFTTADLADIRAKATTSRKFYLDRAKSAFGGYKGGTAVFDGSWKDYLYGFWGQFTMDMLFVVEQDQAWADTAKSWALTAARTQSTWIADDLVPMDITSGIALTYDILYDQFTAAEKTELRKALFASADYIYARFFVDQYWTGDGQNNHLHNRIHGMGNAAFAIYGDDPAYDVKKHADLAASAFAQVVGALPDDGSDHEGPGYWDYSYHWVVRTAHLLAHVTGTDLAAKSPHFANDLYFRAYMTTPGWKKTFGIGDGDSGEPYNMEAIARAIATGQDAHGASILRELMKTDPDGFYQQAAWGLLWYDGDMADKPYAELPLWRYFPDLEMLSVRSSWDADATALVFKCGPPGGNKMQKDRQPNWFNVAHDHPDQNHFLLFSHGTMLAEDDGYPTDKKLTRSHNTLLVDGAGQTREGEAWYQPFDYALTGHVTDLFASQSSAFVTGDASKLYTGANKVVRRLLFVEGGYVVLVDDLAGADGADHDFEWRLHDSGTFVLGAGGQVELTSGDTGLFIQFLAPSGTALSTELLPGELTAPPCLAAKTRGKTAHFVSGLVPQKSGSPTITFSTRSTTGGIGVTAVNGDVTDDIGFADTPGEFTFGDVGADGAAAVVRRKNSSLVLALLVRGSSLTAGGRTLLGADQPANLALRPTPTGASLEVEAAYALTGTAATIGVGGLAGNHRYGVTVDGLTASAADADASGAVSLPLSLAARRAVVLTDMGLLPGKPEVPEAGAGVVPPSPDAGAGAGGAGGAGGAIGSADSSAPGSSGEAPDGQSSSGGCGCRIASRDGHGTAALILLVTLLRRRRRAVVS
jgi:hypothetical protein